MPPRNPNRWPVSTIVLAVVGLALACGFWTVMDDPGPIIPEPDSTDVTPSITPQQRPETSLPRRDGWPDDSPDHQAIPGSPERTGGDGPRIVAKQRTNVGPAKIVCQTRYVKDQKGRSLDLKPTIDRINAGKHFPHRNDGSIFRNRPAPGRTKPELPVRPAGYYHEYVVPTPGVNGPGPMRLVLGNKGEVYFTADHYTTFKSLH